MNRFNLEMGCWSEMVVMPAHRTEILRLISKQILTTIIGSLPEYE